MNSLMERKLKLSVFAEKKPIESFGNEFINSIGKNKAKICVSLLHHFITAARTIRKTNKIEKQKFLSRGNGNTLCLFYYYIVRADTIQTSFLLVRFAMLIVT